MKQNPGLQANGTGPVQIDARLASNGTSGVHWTNYRQICKPNAAINARHKNKRQKAKQAHYLGAEWRCKQKKIQ